VTKERLSGSGLLLSLQQTSEKCADAINVKMRRRHQCDGLSTAGIAALAPGATWHIPEDFGAALFRPETGDQLTLCGAGREDSS
jgi:hypothetical protein